MTTRKTRCRWDGLLPKVITALIGSCPLLLKDSHFTEALIFMQSCVMVGVIIWAMERKK